MNRVFISTEKLKNNLEMIRNSLSDDCKIIAVIKGDAYGHGITDVSKILDGFPGIVLFAAATLEEALILLDEGIETKIIILNCMPVDYLKQYLSKMPREKIKNVLSKLVFSAYRVEDIDNLSNIGECFDCKINIHLRLDFHGSCKGISKTNFNSLVKSSFICKKYVTIEGIYAHVYSTYGTDRIKAAKDLKEYADAFNSIPIEIKKDLLIHLLTSLSYTEFPQYCFDAVRIGAALYGMPVVNDFARSPLLPVMSVRGKVISINDIIEDSEFDYGGIIPKGVKRVAFVSIGVWDAPNFFRGDVTTVNIRGSCYKLVGKPCMDSFSLGIRDIDDVQIGDDVWLLADLSGVSLFDKIEENGYSIDDCQMMFSGMGRMRRIVI